MILTVLCVGIVLAGSADALPTGGLSWSAPYGGQRGSVRALEITGCGNETGSRPVFNATSGKVTGATDYIWVDTYCTKASSSGDSASFMARDRISLPSFGGQSGSQTVTVTWTLSYQTQLGGYSSNCTPVGQDPQSTIEEEAGIVNVTAGNHWVTTAVATQHYRLNQTGVEVAWYNLSSVVLKMHVWLNGSDSYAVWSTFGFSLTVAILGPGAGAPPSCGADARVGPASGRSFAELDSVALG